MDEFSESEKKNVTAKCIRTTAFCIRSMETLWLNYDHKTG